MDLDVVSIGSCNMDIILRVPSFVEPDSEMYVEKIYMQPGGPAFNFAVNMARLKFNTWIIARIGMDRFGEIIKKTLKKEGVNIEYLQESEIPTGVAFISVDKKGRRSVYSYMGANATLDFSKKDIKRIKTADVVYLSGTYWETALKVSKRANIFIYNPGSIIANFGTKTLSKIFKHTYILFANEKELKKLTNLNIEKGARILLDLGVKIVVITRGKKDAIAITENKIVRCPAKKLKVVDTTGAGDAFAAGFIAKWLKNENLKNCLRFGHQKAAQCIKNYGSMQLS